MNIDKRLLTFAFKLLSFLVENKGVEPLTFTPKSVTLQPFALPALLYSLFNYSMNVDK